MRDQPTKPFTYSMQVRFADTDAQGHMYFANYLTFCDEALGAYMRHLGCPWQDLVADGVDMFYRAAKCEYVGSAVFEVRVDIEPRIVRVGNTSVISAYVLRDEAGETIATAELTSVCIDRASRKTAPVPDRLRQALAGD